MIRPGTTREFPDTGLRLEDFVTDTPKPRPIATASGTAEDLGLIDGVSALPLESSDDERGSLVELLTTRDAPIEPIVHVYQVFCGPRSIRAWVYHRDQFDRLAFTMGSFEIALFDVRPESPTARRLNVFALGAVRPALLRIPPYVVHGVRNASSEMSTFLSLPTRAYRHDAPDKVRLPYGDPRVPHRFDD
jgi:dTDP-4-dehydrorhamnose 3,5-epimerase